MAIRSAWKTHACEWRTRRCANACAGTRTVLCAPWLMGSHLWCTICCPWGGNLSLFSFCVFISCFLWILRLVWVQVLLVESRRKHGVEQAAAYLKNLALVWSPSSSPDATIFLKNDACQFWVSSFPSGVCFSSKIIHWLLSFDVN